MVARDAVPPPSMPVRVVVLDVGQGDATVVVLPGGRALLVDAGGVAPLTTGPDAFDAPPGFDIGERVVARALRALGVRRLDGLVLTHGDPDHLLGARGVLKHLAADAIWEGVPVPPHSGLRSLIAFARSQSITLADRQGRRHRARRRRRSAGAPSSTARLGASAGEERRLDRAWRSESVECRSSCPAISAGKASARSCRVSSQAGWWS